MKRIIVILCLLCILTGCSNTVKKETTSVTLQENIEKVSKGTDSPSKSKGGYEVKTLERTDLPSEPVYKETVDEEGNVIKEIYTNDGVNFTISAPEGITIYSLISVKNVMSADGQHGGATVPYIKLEDGNFEFIFGSTDEYRKKGTYTSDSEQLILQADDAKYVFDYEDNGLITYNVDLSDEVPLENEQSYDLKDYKSFFPMSLN